MPLRKWWDVKLQGPLDYGEAKTSPETGDTDCDLAGGLSQKKAARVLDSSGRGYRSTSERVSDSVQT